MPAIGLIVHFDAARRSAPRSARSSRASAWADLRAAGLEPVAWYTDPREWFALSLASPRASDPRAQIRSTSIA